MHDCYIYMHVFSIGSMSQENFNTSCKMKMKCGKMRSKGPGEDLEVAMSNSTIHKSLLVYCGQDWFGHKRYSHLVFVVWVKLRAVPNHLLTEMFGWDEARKTWALWINIWVSEWKSFSVTPQNSPGQNTGVGSLFLLQGIFPTQGSNPGLLHCRWILYQLSHKGRW